MQPPSPAPVAASRVSDAARPAAEELAASRAADDATGGVDTADAAVSAAASFRVAPSFRRGSPVAVADAAVQVALLPVLLQRPAPSDSDDDERGAEGAAGRPQRRDGGRRGHRTAATQTLLVGVGAGNVLVGSTSLPAPPADAPRTPSPTAASRLTSAAPSPALRPGMRPGSAAQAVRRGRAAPPPAKAPPAPSLACAGTRCSPVL